MLTKLKSLVSTLAFLGLVSSTLVVTNEEVMASDTYYQARRVFSLATVTPVAGAATLTRTPKDISYKFYTSDLTPNEAHTIWVVIFNTPENCAGAPGPCFDPSDLGNPAVQASIVAGSGYIVGPSGIANFEGSLNKGTPPTDIQVNVPEGTVNGLKYPLKAEIHLIVRRHGEPKSDGGAVAQLTTYEDAVTCASEGRICADVQVSVFQPAQ